MLQLTRHPIIPTGLEPTHNYWEFTPPGAASTPYRATSPLAADDHPYWQDTTWNPSPNDSLAQTLTSDPTPFLPEKPWPPLKQTNQTVIILVIAYVTVAVVGFVSNFLVVVVILCLPYMKTTTNIFLANLAVADILVCIFVLPITLLDNIYTGRYGRWECFNRLID